MIKAYINSLLVENNGKKEKEKKSTNPLCYILN